MTRRNRFRFISIKGGPGSSPGTESLRTFLSGDHHSPIGASVFLPEDTTAGSETELQVTVAGKRADVDLPLTIEQSNYLANIMRRTAAGDTPRKIGAELNRFLNDNGRDMWENSWVRFPKASLNANALNTLRHDLLADKANTTGGDRSDAGKFGYCENGADFLRVPISYLVKLSLADILGSSNVHPLVYRTGTQLFDHFLSDNTSPETHSFHIVTGSPKKGPGTGLARETAKRFLLTQLLVMYANDKFQLSRNGQKAMIYFSPHPPVRQKRLNNCISDSFYRELFMSPCLSGWDRGEEKQVYMHLCHEALSRSQLNAVAKLHDAGIITSNLVVLPNTSNISLANNGIHVSLGSRTLTRLREDDSSGFGVPEEKCMGDLTIKVAEHFLPLFVKTYSAAPYRLDFADFHPERVLGFLPHELDYTHLRMLWRRWKAKADISFCRRPITPFGPPLLDAAISRLLRLKGDFIPDFRLIDYLVCLLSTEKSPALNGIPGNSEALKKDLSDLGVFDGRMSLYLPFKLREFDRVGFCGFEGRHYSLFPSIMTDMSAAIDLQNLITALAFRYIVAGDITHDHIPDSPFIESERRQIFFGAAIGIPTFFVRHDTDNRFLMAIVERTDNVRSSRRYPGYLRVHNTDYCLALVRLLKDEAADLVELFGMEDTIEDLEKRLKDPRTYSASARLTDGILGHLGTRSSLKMKADEFNSGAEDFYRNALRLQHISEGLDILEDDLRTLASTSSFHHNTIGRLLYGLIPSGQLFRYVHDTHESIMNETASIEELRRLVFAVLLTIRADRSSGEDREPTFRKTGT
jgi:hypothetical protein